MKNRTDLPITPFALLLAAGLLLSCNRTESTESSTVAADSVQEATTDQLDSAETSLETSEDRLDEKAKELENAMEELDTTAIVK